MTVEIRRRRILLGVVAAAAAVLAVGYGWLLLDRGSSLAGWLGAGMLLIAFAHAAAARDARHPALVADQAGIRVRAGAYWWGLTWAEVERVDIRPARRWRDGLVSVVARQSARPRPERWRDRWSLRRNRWRYDAELGVAYGLLTVVSVPDLSAALGVLAGDRLHVLGTEQQPLPTVEVNPAPDGQDEQHPVTEAADGDVRSRPAAGSLVTALRSRRIGRRAELTVAAAAQGIPVGDSRPDGTEVVGSLALDAPDRTGAMPLPEAGALRRDAPDNVSLIVDESTAVAGVRTDGTSSSGTGRAVADTDERPHVVAAPADDGGAPGGIGAVLHHARTLLGVSVDDLAERTSIRPHVIECLERDDMSACGGDVYARGHLRMLAQSLGVDPQPLIARYDATFASEPIRVRDVFDAELSTTGLVRSGEARPRWGILLTVVLLLVVGWTLARYLSADHAPSRPVHAVSTARGAGSPDVGSRLLPGPARATATLRAEGGTARVVVVDRYGRRVFAGQLAVGQTHRVVGVAPLQIRASDGSVVGLTVGGRDRGLLAPVSTDAYGRRIPTPVRSVVRAAVRATP
jgi:cytoskeleton protein RodZ